MHRMRAYVKMAALGKRTAGASAVGRGGRPCAMAHGIGHVHVPVAHPENHPTRTTVSVEGP